ncbi:MAG: DNA polymerase III subunit alpha, partial [Pseudomonadota bacterium]
MSERPFVHLHVHSEYSLVDGIVRLPALINKAKSLGQPAVAVTDQSNLFGAVKFFRAAISAGIKPIIGSEVWLSYPDSNQSRNRLILLCKNIDGFRQLSRLVTKSYREGQVRGVPMLNPEWFDPHNCDQLICLSGGRESDIGIELEGDNVAQAERHIDYWHEIFPERFYLELIRTGRPRELEHAKAVVRLAAAHSVPIVATNDVRFVESDDFEAHEARVCINSGRMLSDPRREKAYSREQFLKSATEMSALFADIPEAIDNAFNIAMRCNLILDIGTYHMPRFPAAEEQSIDQLLREKTFQGLDARWNMLEKLAQTGGRAHDTYISRAEEELQVIIQMGFSGYFLIVADFIQWAKKHDIPVGPGRGSGAGSLVAYALGITDLDPLAYDLIFERFLNPERVSMPDFDIDFCMDRRDEVIDYVVQKYGRDQVAQIITHGTMAAKAVVRDVGRVLGFPYGFVDQIAKLIPFDPNMTLSKAMDEDALNSRYDEDEEVKSIIDLAMALEGIARNAGKHAGGVVIAPSALTEFTPLYCEQDSQSAVTQFDMGDVENIGLVKFDFLGLRTLTIIDWAVRDINRLVGADSPALDIAALPLDDKKTFELIQAAHTTAVFQLESRGMKELIKRLKPDSFDDLIALVALFRPGPLQSGMVDDYIDRKHGRAPVIYPHESLEHILKPTYGVILYQEQVMQIAQVLAGYTLGAADLLRRAMGKKKPEEMAKQRETFVEGATNNDIDSKVAAQIFDLMEKFAGYGFNKSHSAAYALVAYQTAWLKAHHPAPFMAAVLSSDMDSTDKVVRLIEECRHFDITVENPDINQCDFRFTVADTKTILYGLGAIKGVGKAVLDLLSEERRTIGEYRDLFDLCCRNDGKKISKRVLESLIKAGAFDSFGATRRGLTSIVARAVQVAEQQAKDSAVGQEDMFGITAGPESSQSANVTAEDWNNALNTPEWADKDLLSWEKETLGLYLSGHPIDRYEGELHGLSNVRLCDLKPGKRRVAGLIVSVRMVKGRRGQMAIVTLDDKTARAEVTVYSEVLQECVDRLTPDQVCIVEGKCQFDDFSGEHTILAETVMGLDEARNHFAENFLLKLQQPIAATEAEKLKGMLAGAIGGNCPVTIEYQQQNASARVRLSDQWRINLSDQFLEHVAARYGENCVQIEY